MKTKTRSVVFWGAALAVAAVLVLPALRQSLAKSRTKRAFSQVREIATLLFSEQRFLPANTFRADLCERRTDGGAAAVPYNERELRGMLIDAGASAHDLAELGSLEELEVGTFCDCPGHFLWIKIGDAVWIDGYFRSRPSGLGIIGQAPQEWRVGAVDCQSSPLP